MDGGLKYIYPLAPHSRLDQSRLSEGLFPLRKSKLESGYIRGIKLPHHGGGASSKRSRQPLKLVSDHHVLEARGIVKFVNCNSGLLTNGAGWIALLSLLCAVFVDLHMSSMHHQLVSVSSVVDDDQGPTGDFASDLFSKPPSELDSSPD